MIRRAGPGDREAMENFLSRHAETTMFLRGNLAAHGTEEESHPNGTTFYLSLAEGEIRGIAGLTNGGFLMCQAGDASDDFFAALPRLLAGRSIKGMTGAPDQVSRVFAALGCEHAAFSLRGAEPLYALALSDLPPLPGDAHGLRLPQEADIPLLEDWLAAYHAETGTGFRDLQDAARRLMDNPDARLLVRAGEPLAMASFNARAGDMVQIGNVYVPPARRGAGLGGEIVLRQLHRAARDGTRRAILFAVSPFAARAYEKIGFRRIGAYEIALFETPWEVSE